MILTICFYSSLILLSSLDILEQKVPNNYLYFLFIFIFTIFITSDYFRFHLKPIPCVTEKKNLIKVTHVAFGNNI